MSERRTRNEMMISIIRECGNGTPPTRVSFRVCMIWHKFQILSKILLDAGLIEKIEPDSSAGRSKYFLRATQKGIDVVRDYDKLHEVLSVLPR